MPNDVLVSKVERANKIALSALSFVLIVCIALVVFVAFWVRSQRLAGDRVLSCYVIAQLNRAEVALPDITYFKDNPLELNKQYAVIALQRREAIKAWGDCPSAMIPTTASPQQGGTP